MSGPASTMQAMHRIRREQMELQEYLKDLSSWESTIKTKDAKLKRKKASRTAKKVEVRDVAAAPVVKKSKVAHTYTHYDKWDKFDVDAAIAEVDEPKLTPASVVGVGEESGSGDAGGGGESGVRKVETRGKVTLRSGVGENEVQARDEIEKDLGNAAYQRGDFSVAIKHYTRALGMRPDFVAAMSNRALAYLKLRDYARAAEDADDALKMKGCNVVKVLLRRGVARRGLGRLRDAAADFTAVLSIDSSNKEARVELRKTIDQRRAAAKRAPRFSVAVTRTEEEETKKEGESRDDGEGGKVKEKEREHHSSTLPTAPPSRIIEEVGETRDGGEGGEGGGGSGGGEGREKEVMEKKKRGKEMVSAVEELSRRAAASVGGSGKKIPSTVPRSAFELERNIRDLYRDGAEEDVERVQEYLTSVVKPAKVTKLFHSAGLEAPLALIILEAVAYKAHPDTLAFFKAVAAIKRFAMTKMFFTKDAKERLANYIRLAPDPEPKERHQVAALYDIEM